MVLNKSIRLRSGSPDASSSSDSVSTGRRPLLPTDYTNTGLTVTGAGWIRCGRNSNCEGRGWRQRVP
eukprot:9224173-Lingulodinium_polyedra.AAC.1